jgi:hypothetical protein
VCYWLHVADLAARVLPALVDHRVEVEGSSVSIEGVEVECEMSRRLVEGQDEQVGQHIAQSPQIGDRNRVLEPRQSWLAGEIGVVG